jgi:rare lipoprotein A (peptidoglycan hydrolase)
MVTITNRETGATAQCRVQDRGPETWTGHIIDLSTDVFRQLAPLSQGVLSNITLSR